MDKPKRPWLSSNIVLGFSQQLSLRKYRHPDNCDGSEDAHREFRRLKAAFVAAVKQGADAELDSELVASGSIPELDVLKEVIRRLTAKDAVDPGTIVSTKMFGCGNCDCRKCRCVIP